MEYQTATLGLEPAVPAAKRPFLLKANALIRVEEPLIVIFLELVLDASHSLIEASVDPDASTPNELKERHWTLPV